MVDTQNVLGNIGSNVKSALGTTSIYVMYTFIIIVFVVVLIAALYFYLNKKSFNFDVVILRPRGGTNSFDYEAGNIGKHYVDRDKETRFQIYKAKKRGIKYNNEAIDQRYIVKRFRAGKYNPLVFMTPNSQGWLQPTILNLDVAKGIVAQVDNSDISYYQTELELMDAMFNKKTFMEKYYLIILVFLMIIVVLIQWYAASQIHKSSVNYQAGAQAIADAMKYAADRFANNASSTGPQIVKLLP